MGETRSVVVQDEKACLRALLSKQLVPLVLLLVVGGFIWHKASTLDFASIFAAVSAINPFQWTIAAIASAISFYAIGRMDAVVHRLLDTGVSPQAAQLSGIASVATAQITGFGLLTGTLARWRVLSGVSLWQAAAITGAVSVTFMVSLAALVSIATLIVGPDIPGARAISMTALLIILGLVASTVWKPRWLMRIQMPPLKAQGALVALCLLDTAAAALTLYVLLPEAHIPPPALFYCVFLMALGVGLLGTTPGGVGPFEMMLLFYFSDLPQAPVLAAIMGYRIVYFALPASLATIILILGPWLNLSGSKRNRARVESAQSKPGRPVPAVALSYTAQRAEAGLMRQGELDFLVDRNDKAMSLVAPTGQSLIMLTDPLTKSSCTRKTLKTLQEAADYRYLIPCLYKCNAKTAAVARQEGWSVFHISNEAVIKTSDFSLDTPKRRQLRRHLRKAHSLGVKVKEGDAMPPLRQMRGVAEDWSLHRQSNRGFSMGRFEEGYVSAQKVHLAYQGDKLIAFVTFHENWRERTLDLMCFRSDAPIGTTHMLIHHAIETARSDGIVNLSLAAVPTLGLDEKLPKWVREWTCKTTNSAGLHRFKNSFAPNWQPLYFAAPSTIGLALSGVDLADRITRPRHELLSNS